MINFRKLKQEYAPSSLKEGKQLISDERVKEVRLAEMSEGSLRVKAKIDSPYATCYRCEMDIDLSSSNIRDSDCDCPHKYDCHHLAALLFHLEAHLDELIIEYSQERAQKTKELASPVDSSLISLKKKHEEEIVDNKTNWAKDQLKKKQAKELVEEVGGAKKILGSSPFFATISKKAIERCEIAILFKEGIKVELQIAIRLEGAVKLTLLPNVAEFVEAVLDEIPLRIGGRSLCITLESFRGLDRKIVEFLVVKGGGREAKTGDKFQKSCTMDPADFGQILTSIFDAVMAERHTVQDLPYEIMPSLFVGNFEEPLKCSVKRATLLFSVEMVPGRAPKAVIYPKIVLENEVVIEPHEATFYESTSPGLIHHNVYFQLEEQIHRCHLRALEDFQELVVPEPLFGTLMENALPALEKMGKIKVDPKLEKFVTLPYVKPLTGKCLLTYEGEELEAKIYFDYDDLSIPFAESELDAVTCLAFITDKGVRARNIAEEEEIVDRLFVDFLYDAHQGRFLAKNDKKIVEFMTEIIPRNSDRISFDCPEKLKKRFVYDETKFSISLRESSRIDTFLVELKVEGHLKGVLLDLLWDCLLSSRNFIEIDRAKKEKRGEAFQKQSKILVFDTKKLEPIVHLFDEIGITSLADHVEERPLFHLASLPKSLFEGLPIQFSITDKLQQIQEKLLSDRWPEASPIPDEISVKLRPYQVRGVEWLEKLRFLHLGGILADDMGLGKTLQAVCALSQYKNSAATHNRGTIKSSLVVAPTSLLFNWQEEIHRFNPKLTVEVIGGTPEARKKQVELEEGALDVIITSYSLLQRDVEWLEKRHFGYLILDEAQHIKNRTTRNAKSVKQIKADHRLVLTGTPIENSLDELWSLFDFLMPGFLSSFDRFLEKYVKNPLKEKKVTIENLRQKVAPFILRRMKKEVLTELPEATELFYHCRLTDVQKELYHNFLNNAKRELTELVSKQGFEKSQMQILATLTRLKQICCHPALFAKEKAERGDSAKYELFLDLLEGLIEGKHRTVVFSQYTKMLQIMRSDLESRSIPFEYLDGTTKNRLELVKKFNEDENIPVFLVSLKAGGTGLNLVGADTVIQYDLSWNPAVESQAKDRIHRIGQKNPVSCFRLITLDTIEEKILALQNRKNSLFSEVISPDEEMGQKLTWEEALSLLT